MNTLKVTTLRIRHHYYDVSFNMYVVLIKSNKEILELENSYN